MHRYSEMSVLLREIRLQNEESGQMTLIALSEDSHANRSALPAREKVKKTKDSCGENLAASLARLDRVGLSLKTYLDSSVSHLTTYSPIWKVTATGASRLYIQLRLSVRPTDGNGSSLWPTATSRDWKDGTAQSCRNVPINGLLGRAVHQGNWPTPHANCHTGVGEHGEGGDNLQTAVNGQLNPDWVEILMGFPIGWTDIDRNDLESWPGWPASRGLDQCAYEPPRVAKGGKNRAKRLRCLGNAVVPQQAYPIFRAIMEVTGDEH